MTFEITSQESGRNNARLVNQRDITDRLESLELDADEMTGMFISHVAGNFLRRVSRLDNVFSDSIAVGFITIHGSRPFTAHGEMLRNPY